MRVDVQADNSHWAERQIAIVMAATDCTRSEAKAALASCHQHCRTAILMLLSGLDAWHARELLTKHHDHRMLIARLAEKGLLGGSDSATLGFTQGETQMIVMFG